MRGVPELGQKKIPGLKALAKQIGWPHWALKARAQKLGITRTKESEWSEEELHILKHYAWMCDARIQLKLKAAGYTRTKTAIHLKLKRMRFKQDAPYFSAHGLACALGEDGHKITRWIKFGWLKARHRGSARRTSQGGDTYLIHERDVRAFILAHPMEIDLRKVDQLWFLDLITQGKIAS
jgi:hypothetical protein